MPRDYKHRAGRKRSSNTPSPWPWLVTGLAIGLLVAFLVFLQMRPPASSSLPAPLSRPLEKDTRDVRRKQAAPVPPPPKPRFDFYNILPEMEVIVPEQAITGRPQKGLKQVEQPGTYLLQAGSFRRAEQADQLKARLALLGLETRIQTVTVNRRETWHRVRVGPFSNLEQLNQARALLKREGIDAILIRLKS